MFVREVIARSIINFPYETKAIFNSCNRSYDSEPIQGEDYVKIPLLAELEVMEKSELVDGGGNAKTGTGVKEDTDLVTVNMLPKFIRLKSSVEARIMKNPQLLNEYIAESRRKLTRKYNQQVLVESNSTANKYAFNGVNLDLQDFVELRRYFDDAEIPEEGRVCVVSSALQSELWGIEAIQRAAQYNIEMLKKGVFEEFLGFTFLISALVPQYNNKPTVQSFYGPALAAIVSNFTEQKTAYDLKTGSEYTDLISWFGAKLALGKFARVKYKV